MKLVASRTPQRNRVIATSEQAANPSRIFGGGAKKKFAKVIRHHSQRSAPSAKSSTASNAWRGMHERTRREIRNLGGYSRAQWYTAASESGPDEAQILLICFGPLWLPFRRAFAG